MSDAASAAAPCPVVRARSILQKVRYDGNEWFGIDYNMNLYRGCCHGCIYCDSRSECYRIDDFDQVSVKFDALAILQRELRSRRVRGIVGVEQFVRGPEFPYAHLFVRYLHCRPPLRSMGMGIGFAR